MEDPASPQKNPYKVIVEKGKTYFWCACGLSQKQPFCDGTHKKKGKFKSLKYLRSRRHRKPTVIIADTVKGEGIEYISNVPLWHGTAPIKQEDVDACRVDLIRGKNG